MCRFTLYLGPPVRMGSLLMDPDHSLIRQSYQATERSEPLNGDGFGVGWYAPRLTLEPGVFHAVTPAWNNRNLESLSRVVVSPCILAHVRAASPGSEVNLANCHPFRYDRYLLMHNGHIGAFRRIRRRLLESLTDDAFNVIRGSTDSEHLFAVFMDEIIRHGCPVEPAGGGGQRRADVAADAAFDLALRLTTALRRTLETVREVGDGEASYLNVAVSDGVRAAVTRFASEPGATPETLYYYPGELYEPVGRRFPQRRADDEGPAHLISSERLTDDPGWRPVPENHVMVVDRSREPRLFALAPDGSIAEAA